MNAPDGTLEITPELIAEAAAWLSVLHGPRRTLQMERGFAQWLKTSPAHARAFEEATQIWEQTANLPRPQTLRRAPVRRPFFQYALPIAASVLLAAVASIFYVRNSGIVTDVGEQRVLALDDGSRVIMNTGSRVVISYTAGTRKVQLKAGEALFEVAKDRTRPFIVVAGDRQVRALGTTFSVRRGDDRVAVTLVEGRVEVTTDASGTTPTTLSPGERLTLIDNVKPHLDTPPLDKVLAWERREVAFDDTPLADAIAEMNRYSRIPLVVEGGHADQIRVTGLFRAGDSLSFSRALSHAFPISVQQEQGRIVLQANATP